MKKLAMILEILVQALALNAQIESMRAANKEREMRGVPLAYPEGAFDKIVDKLLKLANRAEQFVEELDRERAW